MALGVASRGGLRRTSSSSAHPQARRASVACLAQQRPHQPHGHGGGFGSGGAAPAAAVALALDLQQPPAHSPQHGPRQRSQRQQSHRQQQGQQQGQEQQQQQGQQQAQARAAGPVSASGRPLREPARLAASGSATARVADAGGEVSLGAYLALPISQYFVLSPDQITFLGDNLFELALPPIPLFGARLEPRLEVEVDSRPGAVVLRGSRARLRGTGPLAGLDDKFSVNFSTLITQRQGGGEGPGAGDGGGGGASVSCSESSLESSVDEPGGPQPSARVVAAGALVEEDGGGGGAWGAGWRGGLQQLRASLGGGGGGGAAVGDDSLVMGTTSVEVFCEVIPPFHLMPRSALEATCNAVLGTLVRTLLPAFVRALASDYGRWASDAAYRAERQARGVPMA